MRLCVNAPKRIAGVRKVVPDVERKEVLIAFEPASISEEQLRGQLAQLGFR